MKKFFISFINGFIKVLGGKYSYLFLISITFSIILVFLIQFIVSCVYKKVQKYSYFKFSVFTSLLSLITSLCEFYTSKKVFVDLYTAIIFTLFNLIISYSFYLILNAINKFNLFRTTRKNVIVNDIEEKLPISPTTKKAILKLNAKEDLENSIKDNYFSGYLNVEYVKQLINSLKEKPISQIDLSTLTQFEIYLMNFCIRQPNNTERQKLSEYLSFLIKKLAEYKICS